MKKAITLLLAICMMLSMAVPAFSAETEKMYVEESVYVSPFISGTPDEDWMLFPGLLAGNDITYVEYDQAVLNLREALKDRRQSFYIYLDTDSAEVEAAGGMSAFLENLRNDAFMHTGNSEEGDYITYSISRFGRGTFSYGSDMKLAIPYSVNYNSTAEMEEAVDKKVESLVESLGLENKTTYQKIKSIYDYLCKNVKYDYDHLTDCGKDYSNEHAHSAYAALIDGEAVCQGYALAFYRLALEAGVDARCIAGYGNGGPHAWNIAKIGKYYYNLDATWDAPRKEVGYDYLYFLRNMENFEDHQRYGPEGIAAGHMDYTTAAFNAAYPMSASDYSLSGISIIGDEGIANGYANVSVEITDGTEAAMIQFTLDFDPSELQVESCTAGAAMENLDPSINFDNEEGKIYFAWDAIESITKGGSVLDIVFKISEDAKVDDKLNIDFADKDEEDLIVGTFIGKDQNGKPQYSEINTDFSGGKVTVVDRVTADITGTVIMWNDSNDVSYLVYPADTTDADIKVDAKLADPKKDIGAKVVKGTPTAYGTKQYSQSFTIEDVEEGEYKLVVYKKAHGIWIENIELSDEDITGKDITIYLLGDVNTDGKVNTKDVTRLRQHLKTPNKYAISDYAKLLGDVNGDGKTNTKDVTRLRQHLKTPNKYPLAE